MLPVHPIPFVLLVLEASNTLSLRQQHIRQNYAKWKMSSVQEV